MRGVYLSGAARLSTRADTESLGPRSHILGVIAALRSHGIVIDEFIVGDRMPRSFGSEGSEGRLGRNALTVLAADVMRLALRVRSRWQLYRESRAATYDFAYERYALFQELGSRLPSGTFWILEVNALLAEEATSERRATSSRRLAAHLERRTLRRPDLIVAVTEALKRQIIETYGIPASKVLVVENGVDAAKYSVRDEPTVGEPKRLGFLGALYQWQNVAALLEAMETEGLEHLSLSIAGDGPEKAALEADAAARGLSGRVLFLGRVHPDEVPAFLSKVDICFAGHTSRNGAYFSPLKLWEYLAAGKIVVASRHEATSALEDAGFAVVTYADSSAQTIAAAIQHVAHNYGAFATRVERSRQRVLEEFSWEARVRPIVESIGEKAVTS